MAGFLSNGSRGRKNLEMVQEINVSKRTISEDIASKRNLEIRGTVAHLREHSTNSNNEDRNKSLDISLHLASNQSPKSDILKGETDSSRIPLPKGKFSSTSYGPLSCEIMETESHTSQMSSPEGAQKVSFDSNLASTFHQSTSSDSSSSDSDSSSGDSDSSEKDFSSDDSVKDPNYNQSSSSALSEPPEDEANALKTVRKRKRKADPDTWKKTAAKICRNSGRQYESSSKSKKIFEAKKIGKTCTDKCRLMCTTKIKEEERQIIFDEFWKLGDIQRQRQFMLLSMESIKPKYQYKRENSNRMCNNAFFFQIGEKKIRVCKTYFKGTLAITDRPIRTVLHKKQQSVSGMISTDLRGKHSKHHKTDNAIKEGIRQHIDSIPKIESYYCRKDTTKQYIEGGRSVAELHRDYVDQCKNNNLPYANYLMYFRIFSDFNISFFQPKKDMCEDCVSYTNASEEEKERLRTKYENHLSEKDLARDEKTRDKDKVSDNLIVAVYDLQAVLQCPRGNSSSFYYTSKINVFNFTIFELKLNLAKCYVWDETEGNRGVNEIGSCVLSYLESLREKANNNDSKVLDIIFYSDNCCGQHKNRFMMSMYLFAVKRYPHINSITHKFLVKGHSQNEGDSVHATIERQISKSLRSGPIYVLQQYVTIIRGAKKKGKLYEVHELNYEEFFDLKDLAAKSGFNVLKNPNGELVKISDISILRVEKEFPFRVVYKTSFSATDFKIIEIKKVRTSSTRISNKLSIVIPELKPAYSTKQKIKDKKKEGLSKLMQKNIIPKYYSPFYSTL